MPSAPLYGTMKGNRAVGYQAHRELVLQGQTEDGLVRVIIDKDGGYSIYVGEPDITVKGYGAKNTVRVGTGNLNTHDFTADNTPAGDLPAFFDDNRYIKGLKAAAKGTTVTATPTTGGGTAGGSATAAAVKAEKPRKKGEPAFDISSFPIGTDVVHPNGDTGEVIDDGDDSAGPFIIVEFEDAGEVILRPHVADCPAIWKAGSEVSEASMTLTMTGCCESPDIRTAGSDQVCLSCGDVR